MTTTTLAAPVRATACIRHGLLDGVVRDCPHCGRQAYDLADEGDRATLVAFRKAAMKTRMRTFGIVGAVVGNLAQTVVLFADTGVFDASLLKEWSVAGACVGMLVAWFARRPAHHRLDAALDP